MTALQGELIDIIRRDRTRRARKQKFGEWLGQFIAEFIGGALASLLRGWLLMLAIGVAHDHWVSQLPTIGYWWAVLIVWLLPFKPSTSRAKDTDR